MVVCVVSYIVVVVVVCIAHCIVVCVVHCVVHWSVLLCVLSIVLLMCVRIVTLCVETQRAVRDAVLYASKGGNTSFAEKPELILLKITSFFFSDLLEKKLRITRNRIVIIPT